MGVSGCLLITPCIHVPDAYEFTQSHGNQLVNLNAKQVTFIPSGQLTLEDLSEVRGALYEARAKWYHIIGVEMKLSVGTLNAIRSEFPDMNDCNTEMCSHWLRRIDPCPSWEALTKALKSPPVGEGHLAQQLRDKYCPGREETIPHVYSTPGPSPAGAPPPPPPPPPTSQGS